MVTHEQGITYSSVGTLLPAFGIARMVCTIILGQYSSAFHPKTLIVGALSVIAACMGLIAITSEFWVMLVAFTLFGAAYSVFNLIPYDQVVKLVTPHTEKLSVTESAAMLWRQLYEVHGQMLGPAGGRFLMMVSVVLVDGTWSWRLPWVLVFCVTVVNVVLVAVLGKYHSDGAAAAHKEEHEAKGAREEETYLQQARALYCRPVTLVLLVACFFASFSINGIGVWGPTLAELRFRQAGLTSATIQGGMSAAAVAAFPIGIGLGSTLLQTVTGVKSTLRLSVLFPAVAVVAITMVMLVSDYWPFVISTAAFLAMSYFPYIVFSSFPTLLKYPRSQGQFVLSRFRIAFTLAGTVIAPATVGFLVDNAPLHTTFVVLFVVYCVSAALWFLAVGWTCCPGSPIAEIVDAERRAVVRSKIRARMGEQKVGKGIEEVLSEDGKGGQPVTRSRSYWAKARDRLHDAMVLARATEALREAATGEEGAAGDQSDMLDLCACCTCCPAHKRRNLSALVSVALSGDRYGRESNTQERRDAALRAVLNAAMASNRLRLRAADRPTETPRGETSSSTDGVIPASTEADRAAASKSVSSF